MKISFFATVSLLAFSFCTSKVYDQLRYQKTAVQIDGNISDWSNPLTYFDPKSKLNYSITNDRKNLYVCIKAGDDQSQMKILRGGMEFAIDTAAKYTFPITINFPLSGQERMKQHESREERRSEQSDISKKQSIVENCRIMKIAGFSIPGAIDNTMPINNSYGVNAALAIDKNDVMVYELIIPFKTFYKEELSAADSNKVFSYQVKVKGIAFEQRAGGGNHSGGGGRGGGGGGMSGGGMGGGMRGGGGGRAGAGSTATAVNPLEETDVVHFKARFSYR